MDANSLLQLAADQLKARNPAAAVALVNDAVAESPDDPRLLWVQSRVLVHAAEWKTALAAITHLLEVSPDWPDARFLLGCAFAAVGQPDQAAVEFRAARATKPDDIRVLNNLGNVLVSAGNPQEALDPLRRALALQPGNPDAAYNLGAALLELGDYSASIAAFNQALARQPNDASAHAKIAQALQACGQWVPAEAHCHAALRQTPADPQTLSAVGFVLGALGRLDQSITILRQAQQRWPNSAIVLRNLANALKETGQIGQCIALLRRAVELKPPDALAFSSLAYNIYFDPAADSQTILQENLRWNSAFGPAISPHPEPHANDPDPHRRLRIGYVSADFRLHVIGQNILPIFREHDHARFEIVAYSNVTPPDPLTQKFRGHADLWRDVASLSDAHLAQKIREDRIDVLVDLSMHLSCNRPRVFALRSAPVQVAFAAYPGTTGIKNIDYRLTDPYLDPPGEHDADYSERSIRLPKTFWCYQPPDELTPPTNDLPAASSGYITFGCLNNFAKVSDSSLDLWAKVLAAVPSARFKLLAPDCSCRQRIVDRLAAHGVDQSRIDFLPRRPPAHYVRYYHAIDIALDTLPYNGHTTSLDAMWMGVPLITHVGSTVVGRAGLSQLTNLNLTELIAHTPDQFVQVAVDLASDIPRLTQLRPALRDRIIHSPLHDAKSFTRGIEDAYCWMWHTWCNSREH
jgi:protein O-GlcNAc transferase